MSEPRKQEIEELCVPLECQADTSGDFGFSRDLNAIYEVQEAIKVQLAIDVIPS